MARAQYKLLKLRASIAIHLLATLLLVLAGATYSHAYDHAHSHGKELAQTVNSDGLNHSHFADDQAENNEVKVSSIHCGADLLTLTSSVLVSNSFSPLSRGRFLISPLIPTFRYIEPYPPKILL